MTRRRNPDALTPRERQITAMHAEGIPPRWIVALLKRRESTIKLVLWRAGHKRPEERTT